MKKIAFLFLTIDNPNFTNIWDYYFKGNEDKINIYIHPKNPDNITWHPECIIKNLKPTAWGFIVAAYISLFKTALKNKDNYKFITISESCVPIKPFNEMYNDLIKNKKESYIKIFPITNYDFGDRITSDVKKNIDKDKLIKHYARMCLSRYHIKKILHNLDKIKLFINMHVGDEFFLSSITPLNNYKDIAITHDDWEYVFKIVKDIRKEIKKLYDEQESNNKINNNDKIIELQNKYQNIAKNPKTIIKVSKDDLENMKNTKSYFYRKFHKDSDIEKYIYDFI